MRIAIIGLGGIGSTFAFQLSKAGHEVTVVARGRRLEQLQRDGAVVNAAEERSPVQVSAALDLKTEWDLVLVTVLGHQVDVLLPDLEASAAKTVMFMFNTFESFDRLREVVGEERFAFGFPAIMASVEEGRLSAKIYGSPQRTTVTNAAWEEVFNEAGIPSVVHPDMESWLRSHVVLVIPIMSVGVISYNRVAGVSWAEATQLARCLDEGFHLVRRLGNEITPTPAVVLSRMPTLVLTMILWTLSRLTSVRKSGRVGPGEPVALIDSMNVAAPQPLPALSAVRSYL